MKSSDFHLTDHQTNSGKAAKMINICALIIPQSPVLAERADAIAALRNRIADAANDLFVKLQHRQTMKRFERFSGHGLQDVGFQREWDGSIQPLNR